MDLKRKNLLCDRSHLYDILEKAKYRDRTNQLPGAWATELSLTLKGQQEEGLGGQWNYSSVVADTQCCTRVKTQKTVHHRVNFTVYKFKS